ncbi:hypothetical protein IFM89_018527 [Coptis chinensis]|uniref:RNase H type-1 domain-containing protein n=1 Tax=Coptis chinensis TaxID=261450 RepID=A0A835LSE5_9MAGN|nr:hypothetical protein IFM89_018527 [Coptis chinensis]
MKAGEVVDRGKMWNIGKGDKRVAEAIIPNEGWNLEILNTLPPPIKEAILAIHIRPNCPDKLAGEVLTRHHLNINSMCCFCDSTSEELIHTFFTCEWTRSLWFRSQLNLRTDDPNLNIEMWHLLLMKLEQLDPGGDQSSVSYFIAMLDVIWQVRNKWRFENTTSTHESILAQVAALSKTWQTAFSEEDPISTMPLHVNVIKDVAWINPPPGWVKINFDAAFVNTGTYATLAVVGRDHERRILGGCSKKMKATTSAEKPSSQAENLRLDFALLQQWKDIIFEGDAMEVVEACKHGANSAPLRWRTMLLNMFCNLNSLHSFSFRHTPRACNLLAHKLVAWATKEVCRTPHVL